MKLMLDVVLVEGTDKQAFIDSFDVETQADSCDKLDNLPCCVCMHVEESYLETFKQDSRVASVNARMPFFSPDLPSVISQTKFVTAEAPSTTANGTAYMGLQFYYDSDQIPAPIDEFGNEQTVGCNTWNDELQIINNATYASRWAGKNVDIVTLEVGGTGSGHSTLAGVHDSHPDFDDLDNPGTSRVMPMNWQNLSDAQNNQVASNEVFSDHGMGVLSAAAGSICGFAKRATLRAAYISGSDGTVNIINSIIGWHNSKGNNPDTGVPNPTIMIAEYQSLLDRRYAIKMDDVDSITDLDGTVNRPVGGSWGTDFTPFTNRGIIPFQVYDSDSGSYNWCVVMPWQSRNTAQQEALRNAWDAGIVCINAAGNNGGVFVKESDSRYNGVYISCSGSYDLWTISYFNNTLTKSTNSTATWYPFIPYGPHGEDKGIDVAAGQNSEAEPILDGYTNRGPGIDIVGLGARTWTSYPSNTYADGNKWGMFSGTSCATPTVVGKAACLMEKYFYYKGAWPTPNETKQLLLQSAKDIVKGLKTAPWDDISPALTVIQRKEDGVSGSGSLVRITTGSAGNGGYTFLERAGTTTKRAFFNARGYDRKFTKGKRPAKGALYPRLSKRIGSNPSVEFAENASTPTPTVTIAVTSTSWADDAAMPETYWSAGNGGDNTSPQLSWSATGDTSDIATWDVVAYSGTTGQILWYVDNIPNGTTSIAENGTWPAGTNIYNENANQRANGWYGPNFSANTGVLPYYIVIGAYHLNGALLGLSNAWGGTVDTTQYTGTTFPITVTGSNPNYIFNGNDAVTSHINASDPTITVNAGDTLEFDVNAGGNHPFWIKTAQTTGTGDGVTTGTITNNGQDQATVTWDTTGVTPGTYYYICQIHVNMRGEIVVQ